MSQQEVAPAYPNLPKGEIEFTSSTFFERVTDSKARKSRIEELKSKLGNSLKEDQNLGISQNNRERAKRDLEFMRDLTELAILTIADGTIKTAEAFRNYVKGLGISEDVANKAYTDGVKSAEEYKKWAGGKEKSDVRIGEVLSNIQDVTIDRTAPKTKITPKKVKQITEGGIKGKVDLTNRQALKHQIQTLNRGIKEGKAQLKEARNAIKDLVKELQSQGVFRGKVRGTTVRKMLNAVNSADTPAKLLNALNTIEKAATTVDYDKKLDTARNLKKRADKAKNIKGLPINLKQALKNASKVNPEKINSVEKFNEVLGEFLTAIKGIKDPTQKSVQDLVDEFNEFLLQNKIENLKQSLLNAGFDPEYVDTLDTVTKLQEAVATLPKEKRSAESIREAREEYYNSTKELLEEDMDSREFSPLEKRIVDHALKLDPSKLTDKELKEISVILGNIYANNDFSNAGRLLTSAKKQENLNDKKSISKIKEVVRTVPQWLDKINKNVGTVIAQIDSLIGNRYVTSAFWKLVGFDHYLSGATKYTQRVNRDIKDRIDAVYKKYGADLSDGKNSAILSMFAELNQFRASWDADRVTKEFNDRKEAIEKSIERMKDYAKVSKTFKEKNKNLLKNIEDAYNIIKDLNSPDEIYSLLNDGHKALYQEMRDFYDSIFLETIEVNKIFGNKSPDADWVNYIPRSYTTLSKASKNNNLLTLEESAEGTLFEVASGISKETSGAGESRTITGNSLPIDKAINFNVLDAFFTSGMTALYDIETWEARQYASSILRDSQLTDVFGDVQVAKIFERALLQKVNNDIRGISTAETSKLDAILSFIQKQGTRLGLGGVDQLAKQTVPQLADTFARVGGLNPKRSLQASQIMGLATRAVTMHGDLFDEMIDGQPLSVRNVVTANLETQSISRAQMKESARIFRNKLFKGLKVADEVIDDISLGALRFGDTFASRVTWMSYYLDYRITVDGVKNINIEEEMANPKKEAVDFATAQGEISLNVSDPTLKSDVSRALLNGRLLTIIQPFISFALNSKTTLLNDLVKLNRKGLSNEEVKIITGSIAGNLFNIVGYQAIATGIRALSVVTTVALAKALIETSGDWDDEEKELAKQIVDNWGEDAQKRNLQNSTSYLLKDLVYGGIAEGIMEPIINTTEDLARASLGLEAVKRNYRPESAADRLGGFGIWFSTALRTAEVMKEAVLSDEEFQLRKFGLENAWGEDFIVPVEKQGVTRPEASRTAYGLTSLIHGTALTGASQQFISGVGRRLPSVIKHLENELYGKDKTLTLRRLESLKEVSIDGISVELTEEQYQERLKVRKELLKELYFSDDFITATPENLKDPEFRKRLKEAPKLGQLTVKDELALQAGGDEASEKRLASEVDKISQAIIIDKYPELQTRIEEGGGKKINKKVQDVLKNYELYIEWLNNGKKVEERLPKDL